MIISIYNIFFQLKVPSARPNCLCTSKGMLLALVFLLGVCVVVCLVKRNRGGKYAVQEQEVARGRPQYDEGGFTEYTQP